MSISCPADRVHLSACPYDRCAPSLRMHIRGTGSVHGVEIVAQTVRTATVVSSSFLDGMNSSWCCDAASCICAAMTGSGRVSTRSWRQMLYMPFSAAWQRRLITREVEHLVGDHFLEQPSKLVVTSRVRPSSRFRLSASNASWVAIAFGVVMLGVRIVARLRRTTLRPTLSSSSSRPMALSNCFALSVARCTGSGATPKAR